MSSYCFLYLYALAMLIPCSYTHASNSRTSHSSGILQNTLRSCVQMKAFQHFDDVENDHQLTRHASRNHATGLAIAEGPRDA